MQDLQGLLMVGAQGFSNIHSLDLAICLLKPWSLENLVTHSLSDTWINLRQGLANPQWTPLPRSRAISLSPRHLVKCLGERNWKNM